MPWILDHFIAGQACPTLPKCFNAISQLPVLSDCVMQKTMTSSCIAQLSDSTPTGLKLAEV